MKPILFLRFGALSAAAAGFVFVAACAQSRVTPEPLSWREANPAQPIEKLVVAPAPAEGRARAAETSLGGVALAAEADEDGVLADEDAQFTAREERGSALARVDEEPVLTNVGGPLRVQAGDETYRLSPRDELRLPEAAPELAGPEGAGAEGAALSDVGYGSSVGGAPIAPPVIVAPRAPARVVAPVVEDRAAEQAPIAPAPQGPQSSTQGLPVQGVPADFDGTPPPGMIDESTGVDVPVMPDNSAVFGPAFGNTLGVGFNNNVGVNNTGVVGGTQLPVGAGGVAQVPSAGVGAGDALSRATATGGRQTAEQLATPPGTVQPGHETVDQLATPPRFRTPSPGPGIPDATQPQSVGGADPTTGLSTTTTSPEAIIPPATSPAGAAATQRAP